MKTYKIKSAQKALFLLLCFVISFGFMSMNHSANNSITLLDALKDPTITVEIKSVGGHSGKCVELKIKSPKNLSLKIEEGTLFNPSDDGEQTLIAPRAQLFALTKNIQRTILVDGFCTEASNRSPTKAGIFKVTSNKDTSLQKLVQFFNKNGVDNQNTVQEAIWCVTDDMSIANVHLGDKVKNDALKQLLSKITKNEIPWHSAQRDISHDEQGNISTVTTDVSGMITFSNDKATIINNKVINAAGVIQQQSKEGYKLPIVKNVTLKFHVQVSGWEKGNYAVIYYNSAGETIVRKDFVL